MSKSKSAFSMPQVVVLVCLRVALVCLRSVPKQGPSPMAVTIYRFQITSQPSVLNRYLIASLCNEMTHYQDFQVKLYEYGLRPNPFRWAFWLVGLAFGLGSRPLGPRAILKTGVWVEAKAVDHYGELLSSVAWDPETRAIVEKDRADEQGHIDRWRRLLAERG